MARACLTMLLFALAAVGQADARSVKGSQPKLSPPLKDAASDKKFFGPPFPADYPDDKRPVVSKSIMDKLKGPDQPYPALQSKEDFDRDYVKDENSDTGAWKAQFDYDALRKKLAWKEADERAAKARADREGRDADEARRNDDDAAKKVADALKDAEDAAKGEDDAQSGDDAGAPPSTNDLDEIKRRVADCETKYEQALKNFKECERQLEEAKANLESLKAQQKALEEKLAADTKLYAEQKAVRLNLKKTKQEEAARNKQTAEQKLAAAEKTKKDLEAVLAKEKAESDKAQLLLKNEKAKMAQAKKLVDEAALRLQIVHGYKPALQAAPSKSGAQMVSAINMSLLLLSAITAVRSL